MAPTTTKQQGVACQMVTLTRAAGLQLLTALRGESLFQEALSQMDIS